MTSGGDGGGRHAIQFIVQELAETGVYAAHMAIDVSIDVPAIPGFPTAPAAEYWVLHTKRQERRARRRR